MVCPKCKSDRVHRSHRRGALEQFLGLFGMQPHRCHACEHRFLRFRYAAEPASAGPSSTEREIRSTRRSIAWKNKRREFLLYGSGFLLFLAFLYYITRQRGSGDDGN